MGLHGIVWESMGKSRLAVGCARRATPVTRSPQSRSAVEKPSAAPTKIAENPCPSVLCDTDPTPVHKGAGRKPVAIDPSEVVVQGTQRVVPLRPELW